MAHGFELPKKKPINPEKIRENALFHYTDAKGLIGIIEKNRIWATAYYCTNDRSEFNYFIEVIKQLFYDYLSSKFPEAYVANSMCAERMSFLYKRETKKIRQLFNTYISCFTKAKDDESYKDGLLSQWRAYGKDGGYAIELDIEKYIQQQKSWNQKFKTSSSKSNSAFTNFSAVEYGKCKENRFTKKLYKVCIKPWIDQIVDINSISPLMMNINLDNMPGAKGALIEMAAYTKNINFREEQEYRLIVLDKGKSCKHFNRNGLIVPFIETEIEIKSCINRIIIGPSPRIEDREKSVRSLLMRHDLSNVEVEVSQIPYDRG